MKTNNKLLFIFFLAATCCLYSCTKEGDKGTSDCRLTTVTITARGQTEIYNLTYNNDGQLSTINVTGATSRTKVFNYSGNLLLVNNTAVSGSVTVSWLDSIVFDDRKRPVFMRQYTPGRISWTDNRFTYNGDEMTRSEQTSNTQLSPQVSTCFYTGGNMTRVEAPHATTILEYYMNEERQVGDYVDIAYFINFGIMIFPHVNLVKSQADNLGNVTNYSYEKNNDGQIASCTATSGGDITTLLYQYACN